MAGVYPARQIIREEQSEHHTSGPPGCADVNLHPMKRQPNTSNWITCCMETPNGAMVLCIESNGWVSLVLKCRKRTIQWQDNPQEHKHIQCTVEYRFATVRFTIHFYDHLSSRTEHSRLVVHHCRNSSVLSVLSALLALFRSACVSSFSILVQFKLIYIFPPMTSIKKTEKKKKSKQLPLHSFLMSSEPRLGTSSAKYKVIWLIFFQLSV